MNCPANTPIVGDLQTVSLNRGTLLKLKGQRKDDEGQVITVAAQEAYFIVKKRWTDKTPVISKSLEDMTFDEEGYYHITLNPEDTENLAYGKYVWDFTAIENDDEYRVKPAHGYLIIGNSSGWIVNETEQRMAGNGEIEITLTQEPGEQTLILQDDTPVQELSLEPESVNYQYIIGAVTSVNGEVGDVVLTTADLDNTADFVEASELSGVAFTGNYEDLENEPTTFTEDEWDLLWTTY